MEINLTRLWEKITFPFAVLLEKMCMVRKRGRRARSRYHRLSPEQKRLRMIRIARWMAAGVFGAILFAIVSFFVMFAWYSRDLPKPGEVIRREGFSTEIYDRNGKLLYSLFDTERRKQINIENVPEHLKNATVAVEDKDFYNRTIAKGFDPLTVLRIPYYMLSQRRVVGGSTLTQQLVKNVLLTNERRVSRKFKELVLSVQIERTFTKDDILEMYLNEAPYGGTSWGVGSAAEIYFNKPITELNLLESAVLAGLPQRPTAYSPFRGKQDDNGESLWVMRTRGVLRRMHEDGYITQEEYDSALEELDKPEEERESLKFERAAVNINAPHFVFYVRDKLAEMYGDDLVEKGGLKVTTSLDLEVQDMAQEIVKEEIEDIEDYDISNGAAMVMNAQNGEILAMVGSRDYFDEEIDGQFNVAVDGLRQPGSSIKPVTYLAMLRRGYTPASMIMDVETVFAPNGQSKRYEPKNYDGKFRGPVSLRNALGSSLNLPAVKCLATVGIEEFLSLAYEMGFPTLEPTTENFRRFGLALTLGGGEVHLIDTVSAYSSFATGGLKVEPVSIIKVEDRDGHVLYDHKHLEGKRIFAKEEAFLINNILSDNNARSMAFGTNSLLNTGQPIAVKTGTTNDQRDNWTIGWSHDVIVGSWVGNNDNSKMSYVASGITGASPIWRKIMLEVLKSEEYNAPEWEMPEDIEEVEVDLVSGYPKHDDFAARFDYVIKGTLPSLPDPIHQKMKLCKGENKLASEAKIAAGDYDEKEKIVLREDDPFSEDDVNRWQEAIDAWIEAQEDERYKVSTEYCGDSEEVSVNLRRPKDETNYDKEDIEVKIEAGSDKGIEKIELYVNGELKKTIEASSFHEDIHFSKGRYELYAKATARNGKEAKSNVVRIGTGGEDWEPKEPTPTPQPTALPPSPTPKIKPTVAAPTPTPEDPTPTPE